MKGSYEKQKTPNINLAQMKGEKNLRKAILLLPL